MRFLHASLIALSATLFTSTIVLAQEEIQAQVPTTSPTINAQAGSETTAGASCSGKHHRRGAMGERGESVRHHGGGHLQAIKSLPSLTPDQSKQLDAMMQSYESDMKPLRQEAKALHQKIKEGGDNAQATARLQELRDQFRTQRKELKQKALGILTPEQKKELGAGRNKPAQPLAAPTQS